MNSLINFKISLQITLSANCFIIDLTLLETFPVTDTKIYVSVVAPSIPRKPKLLEQLKPGLKRAVSWNKYQSKLSI